MSDFQGIVTGNIASTPISKTANMSPTEIAAFTDVKEVEQDFSTAGNTNNSAWEEISSESWNEPGLTASVSNIFRRVTRRMEVDNGYLYSVATYALCYVRGGSANFSSSESLAFVPNAENTGIGTKSIKPKK